MKAAEHQLGVAKAGQRGWNGERPAGSVTSSTAPWWGKHFVFPSNGAWGIGAPGWLKCSRAGSQDQPWQLWQPLCSPGMLWGVCKVHWGYPGISLSRRLPGCTSGMCHTSLRWKIWPQVFLFPSISRNLSVNHCFILPSRRIWDSLWALMYQMNGIKWSSNVCYVGHAGKQREQGRTVMQNRKIKSVHMPKQQGKSTNTAACRHRAESAVRATVSCVTHLCHSHSACGLCSQHKCTFQLFGVSSSAVSWISREQL